VNVKLQVQIAQFRGHSRPFAGQY